MSAFLDRSGGGLRLYLDGDLQLDSSDEKLYHAPLGAAADVAARRRPGKPLRALILGGGDGLAARELLAREAVASVDLVDRDPEVLALGRGALAELNAGAFDDARLRTHEKDVRDFLPRARGYDVAVFDLTYPDTEEGAALLTKEALAGLRRALRPEGVLALNAVSPEQTPEAFVCLGATLRAAGLHPLAYAFDLPSFRREGYGRWGFYFCSKRRISLAEAAKAGLGPGLRLPAALSRLRVGANEAGALRGYLAQARPLAWEPPFLPLRPRSAAGAPGPVSAAQGFAAWLAAPRGRRTLEELLSLLPAARRRRTRAAVLEWSLHAEAIFQEADLRAYCDAVLARASELPEAWRRELRRLRDAAAGLELRPALEQFYRAVAVLLIVLILANLCFPDNLYAKGFSSHYGGSYSGSSSGFFGGASGGAPSEVFSYSRGGYTSPYRYRYRYGGYGDDYYGGYSGGYFGRRRYYSRPYYRDQVYDAQGQPHPSQRLQFTDPKGGAPKVDDDLLALTAELHVLESGVLSYKTGFSDFQAVLEPRQLRVLDAAGAEVLRLLPPPRLSQQARERLSHERPVLVRAMDQHKRWLSWVGWAKKLPVGRSAASEMAALEKMDATIAAALEAFNAPPPPSPDAAAYPGALELFPGVLRDAGGIVFLSPEGTGRRRSLMPPVTLTPEDRFVFRVLYKRFVDGKDESLRDAVAAWIQVYGKELGVAAPSVVPAPSSPTPMPPGSPPPIP